MPILDIQQRLRELGRIRIGETTELANGKRRPTKLETFRITSASKSLVESVAAIYGGEVVEWEEQWQVVTETAELDIVLPPMEVVEQWNEMWSGGGCQRRCDGRTEVLQMRPCVCPEDPAERAADAANGEACKPTTRLRVMLPQVAGIGVWRLETHSYYAAAELGGVADLLASVTGQGRTLPARLRLEQRQRKQPGQPTKKFAVPVIDIDAPIGEFLSAVRQVEAPEPPPSLPRGVQRVPLEGDAPPAPSGDAAGFDFDAQDHANALDQVEVLLSQLDGRGDAEAARDYANKGLQEAKATIRRLEKELQGGSA